MISSKQSINHLAHICSKAGIEDAVFSSGSRNAPVIIAFTSSGRFNCYSVFDERSAAFIALGLSIASGKATVICCTSGSAAANYSPAICEAFYQGIPMIVLTADRPGEFIDQGIGQSIRQMNMYQNFVKQSFELTDASNKAAISENDLLIQQAIATATTGFPGPVHINLPFAEPLYEISDDFEPSAITWEKQGHPISADRLEEQDIEIWNKSKRKLLLFGQYPPGSELSPLLQELINREDIIVMTETTSNLNVRPSIGCIDRVITSFEGDEEAIRPDLLITMGGPVISKKIKKLFLDFSSDNHWDIRVNEGKNTFRNLTRHIRTEPQSFTKELLEHKSRNDNDFLVKWLSRNEKLKQSHVEYLNRAGWSDLKAFELVLKSVPPDYKLHLANSTPVRYTQLFDQRMDLSYFSNRGVSGIDGCTSTAMGYAIREPNSRNLLLTGDLAFFYDSNAFFHDRIPDNFQIILINNSGGGIFRIIDGPSGTHQLEKYFESVHNFKADHLAAMYGLNYYRADNQDELDQILNSNGFFSKPRSIVEIITPRTLNDKILEDYFKFLKANEQ